MLYILNFGVAVWLCWCPRQDFG